MERTGRGKQAEESPESLGEKLERLAAVMATLRAPDGCPWDLEQTPQTLSRHLLEEAYEAVEAIDHSDWRHLSEELWDMLLQIVFQARIAEESGRFDLGDVIDCITEKLERRHPHIFGDAAVENAAQVSVNWDRIKREEEGGENGATVRLATGLPAMMAAMKIQGQAARAGFDWSEGEEVFGKLEEEVEELREAHDAQSHDAREAELGDILFTVVNLARHMQVDPEGALRRTCIEFARRYQVMERLAADRGVDFESLPLEEKDRLWEQAKRRGDSAGEG